MAGNGLPRAVETVVVGAGQAGLTASWHLQQAGREHIILDRRDRLGGGWQDRWDRFRLVSPNWTASFSGFPYDGADPDGFMPRDDVVARVTRYAGVINAPVELGTEVRRLIQTDGTAARFRVETNRGVLDARSILVAAGGFHTPRIPAAGTTLSERVLQLHSHGYTNEAALPPGGVLVVGSGQSGVQIAEELHEAGRPVVLAVGHCGRMPRRYRGSDIFYWLWNLRARGEEFGTPLPSVDKLADQRLRFACNPHVSGHGGGHETNLRRFAAGGIRLVGRLADADDEVVRFGSDLSGNLRFADGFFDDRFRTGVDTFIERAGIDAPPDDREPFEYEPPEVGELDLAAERISSVIWTSGYAVDFRWIDLPIFDEAGMPRHNRGISEVPGLTFLGLPWQLNQGSAALFGVGLDAQYLAERW